MRAVNLIPADVATRPGIGGGRSGGGAYVVLVTLVGLLVMVSLWALAGRDVSQRRGELARTQAQATAAQAAAAGLADFGAFARLRAQRTTVVRTLAAERFDWAGTLDAIARLVPRDVRLGGLSGTVAGAAPAGVGTTSPVAPGPGETAAVQVSGCAPSQARVARLMPRLRAVPGVAHVRLGSSAKQAAATPGATAAACSHYAFGMTLAFAAPAGATAAPVSGAVQ